MATAEGRRRGDADQTALRGGAYGARAAYKRRRAGRHAPLHPWAARVSRDPPSVPAVPALPLLHDAGDAGEVVLGVLRR